MHQPQLDRIKNVKKEVFLGGYTTFGTGGIVKFFIEPESVKELKKAVKILNKSKIEYTIIGNGSNILVSDRGYDGAVIRLKNIRGLKVDGTKIEICAGENLSTLINASKNFSLAGVHKLVSIPATVGGAIKMNASAFGQSVSERLESVKILTYDGRVKRIKAKSIEFGYRDAKIRGIILSATFNLERSEDVAKEVERCKSLRLKKQPTGRTCGSVFKNPEGHFAGMLIEKAGLKGYRVNGAVVSEKHANFIVNEGKSSKDIYTLIRIIKNRVYEKFGIDLEEEVKLVGEFK